MREVRGIILAVRLTDVQSAGDPAMRNLAVNLLLVTTRNSAALCSALEHKIPVISSHIVPVTHTSILKDSPPKTETKLVAHKNAEYCVLMRIAA